MDKYKTHMYNNSFRSDNLLLNFRYTVHDAGTIMKTEWTGRYSELCRNHYEHRVDMQVQCMIQEPLWTLSRHAGKVHDAGTIMNAEWTCRFIKLVWTFALFMVMVMVICNMFVIITRHRCSRCISWHKHNKDTVALIIFHW